MNYHSEEKPSNSKNRFAWIALLVLFVIYISSFVDRQIIAVLASQIRAELNLTNAEIGILYGPAFSWIYAIVGLFMGRLADLVSRKKIILTGLTIWSLMTFISGFAGSLSFLIAARIGVGISQASLSPAVYSILSDYFDVKKRATVFSLYASAIFIGVGLSFLIGGSVAEAYDWRVAMKSVGLPGVFIALIGIFLIKEPTRRIEQNNSSGNSFISSLRYILKKKTVRFHLAGFSLLALSGYTILAFISTVLTEEFNAPEKVATYGWFMFLTGVSVNISGWLADRLAHRFSPKRRFMMGIVAALGGLPFYYAGFFSEMATVAFILIGIGNVISSSYNGVAAALIQYFVTSEMRGVAGSLYLFVVSIVGFGIGPPITGYLIDHFMSATEALMLVFVVCGVLSTFCFMGAMKYYENDVLE
jgi:MFS family permease